MANALVSNVGTIIPMGVSDIEADDAQDAAGRPTTGTAKGQLSLLRDDFGARIFRYMHNMNGAVTLVGGLYSRAADVSIASIDAGSTTLLIKKAAGFTANALIGRAMYYKTNATTAGAAPEGETAIIASNTAGQLVLNANRPLTATPNAADAVVVYSLFDFIASASGNLVQDVFGIALARNGISNGNWGVVQCYGYCPDAKFKATTALAAGKALKADTEQVSASSTTAVSQLIGWAPEAVNNPNALKTLVFIDCFSHELLSA